MEKTTIRILLILFFGLLTTILSFIIPVAGGGVSLIFVVTVPIIFVIAVIFSIIYYKLESWKYNSKNQNIFFFSFCSILIFLAFSLFPYR